MKINTVLNPTIDSLLRDMFIGEQEFLLNCEMGDDATGQTRVQHKWYTLRTIFKLK